MKIKKIQTYRNNDIGLIVSAKCFQCGKKHWVLEGNDKKMAIFTCLECQTRIRIKVRIDDLRVEDVINALKEKIKSGIVLGFDDEKKRMGR